MRKLDPAAIRHMHGPDGGLKGCASVVETDEEAAALNLGEVTLAELEIFLEDEIAAFA